MMMRRLGQIVILAAVLAGATGGWWLLVQPTLVAGRVLLVGPASRSSSFQPVSQPTNANSATTHVAVAADDWLRDQLPSPMPVAALDGSGLARRRAVRGDHDLRGLPSISVQTIERVLASSACRTSGLQSTAVGLGQTFYDLGLKYGVDPAWLLAFFVHESSCGTDGAARCELSRNVYRDGVPACSFNPGNIRWTPGYFKQNPPGNCCFRAFDNYAAGAEDWYGLIIGGLYFGDGRFTPQQIIPRYAPSGDCTASFCNDENAYVRDVTALVVVWRAAETNFAAGL